MSLRITHIISSLSIGGAQQLVLDLSHDSDPEVRAHYLGG
jgi:hypothetical protein